VVGAGEECVNGTYLMVGTLNGHPYYESVGECFPLQSSSSESSPSSISSDSTPGEPIADYTASGATSPTEANGGYAQQGTYNGKPYYQNTTSGWYLFFQTHLGMIHNWWISPLLGTNYITESKFTRTENSATPSVGVYNNQNGSTGTLSLSQN
jgi:hypothetical protein